MERQPRRVETKELQQPKKEILLFMGPEGSGKTTLAKKHAAETGKPRITIGDILRDMAANDKTELGDECRAMFQEHRYLKPHYLVDILSERFKKDDVEQGFILDGGLRTIEETHAFPDILKRAGRTLPLTAVYLHIPSTLSEERLLQRGREDDTHEGIQKRLDQHYKNLNDRTSFIQKQPNWKIHFIDATGTIEQNYGKLQERIRNN